MAELAACGSTRWPRKANRRADDVGVHFSIAPTWFDPAETPGIITPFMFLYALHDALVKPMPDNQMTPSLATSGARVRMASPTTFSCGKG